jgi:hypothetical protein
MSTTQSPSEISDRLFDILSSSRFLDMEGLGNEVPIFIQPYAVAEEERMSSLVRSLVARMNNTGISATHIDLFELIVELLQTSGRLTRIIEKEPSLTRQKMMELMSNLADPGKLVAPALAEKMKEPELKITILTGAGHVYPFLRTHQLLENIQASMMRHPLVLFFPGEYTQTKGLGSQLRLFGTQPAKGYYRAFNLDHYRLHQS